MRRIRGRKTSPVLDQGDISEFFGSAAPRGVSDTCFKSSGFTTISAARDHETIRELQSAYFERTREIVARYGGIVEKFIGDAVMGLFGAPLAHGDDAERAVRAALVVRDSVGELAGGDLQIRIAVKTGEAVVSLGARPAFGESMVTGDVVNTASRPRHSSRAKA